MCASCKANPTEVDFEAQRMSPEIKAKWLAALRSGEFKQGKGKLRLILPSLFKKGDKGKSAERHCCLGVLDELYRRETGKGHWEMDNLDGEYRFYDSMGSMSRTMPTIEVYEWAGMNSDMFSIKPEDGKKFKDGYGDSRTSVSLAALNDEGRTYKTIADLIEKYL